MAANGDNGSPASGAGRFPFAALTISLDAYENDWLWITSSIDQVLEERDFEMTEGEKRAAKFGYGVGMLLTIFFGATAYRIFDRDNINVDLTAQQEHIVGAGLVDIEQLREETKEFVDSRFAKYTQKMPEPSKP